METKRVVEAKITNKMMIKGEQILLVRPSTNNMHQFVATENSCFFDICLPNYTNDSLRRITYFEELTD
jgi:hypothetical protein